MLNLPGQPLFDKQKLVGACVRLPLNVDAQRLHDEVAALPAEAWAGTGGRVGVHSATRAIFLRGYAPAEGEKPIEDRPTLDALPYVRFIIESLIPAQPLRCLLARLPAATAIPPHIDRAPYFSQSLRLHVPVETHDHAWMLCGGQGYLTQMGEIWVLNNSTEHAVWNAHPTLSRTHLICDFLPGPPLLELLEAGDRDLGKLMPDAVAAARERGHTVSMAGG